MRGAIRAALGLLHIGLLIFVALVAYGAAGDSRPWLIQRSFRNKYATAVRLFHARGFQDKHHLPSGWMSPYSAYVVLALSEFQRSLHVVGSLGELGVYHGLFFIALAGTAFEGERLFACDLWSKSYTYMGSQKTYFFRNLRNYGVNATTIRIFNDSTTLTPDALEAAALTPVRLLSIDGDHSLDATLSDLNLASTILAEGGIVALDDFRNKMNPGVAQAVQRYCEQPGFVLAPFLLVAGKLYLTTASHHSRFLSMVWNDLVLLKLDMARSNLCGRQIAVVDPACCDDQRSLAQGGLQTLWDEWYMIVRL
eukprot:TRINITY_DN63042_c0_g1_i1.p1 TRINITY_DN63042_c0_g1~~TRINITY_DN63042_c0_g1_i1.p1  ORF type:complete len:309 (-),score=22.81 TRINITY_DN63042_c0_g1_i1:45-971(-)